jgi:hypothetical protein
MDRSPIGDFYAPQLHEPGGAQAKRRLERIVAGKSARCRAGRSCDRDIGYRMLGGLPLGRLIEAAGGIQDGRGWPVMRGQRQQAREDQHGHQSDLEMSGATSHACVGTYQPVANAHRLSANNKMNLFYFCGSRV